MATKKKTTEEVKEVKEVEVKNAPIVRSYDDGSGDTDFTMEGPFDAVIRFAPTAILTLHLDMTNATVSGTLEDIPSEFTGTFTAEIS